MINFYFCLSPMAVALILPLEGAAATTTLPLLGG
jgi:hypothetical protein